MDFFDFFYLATPEWLHRLEKVLDKKQLVEISMMGELFLQPLEQNLRRNQRKLNMSRLVFGIQRLK